MKLKIVEKESESKFQKICDEIVRQMTKEDPAYIFVVRDPKGILFSLSGWQNYSAGREDNAGKNLEETWKKTCQTIHPWDEFNAKFGEEFNIEEIEDESVVPAEFGEFVEIKLDEQNEIQEIKTKSVFIRDFKVPTRFQINCGPGSDEHFV